MDGVEGDGPVKSIKLLLAQANQVADWLTRITPRGQEDAERIHQMLVYLRKASRD